MPKRDLGNDSRLVEVSVLSFRSPAIATAVQSTRIPQLEALEARRLMAAGDLDDTFSGDGRVTIAGLGVRGAATAVAVQSDGKIVVAGIGTSASGQSSDAVVLRYNADGSLDENFGDDGIFRLDFGGNERFDDVAVLSNGKILAAGSIAPNTWAIARLDPDGTIDDNSGFGGTDGVQTGSGAITDIAIQGSKIISAGGSTIRRHNSSGSIDGSFGSSGSVNVSNATGLGNYAISDIEIGPASLIYVTGEVDRTSALGGGRGAAISRFNGEGSLDTGFGNTNVSATPVTGLARVTGSVVSNFGTTNESGGMAVEAGGGAFFGVQPNGEAGRVFHLTSSGTPDADFGSGSVNVTFGPASNATKLDAIALLNGAPVGSGIGSVSGQPSSVVDSGIARITRGGQLDQNVSDDGIATADSLITSSNASTQLINTPAGVLQLRSAGANGVVTSHLFRYRSVPAGFYGEITLSPTGTLTYTGSDENDYVFFQKVGDIVRVTAGNAAVEYPLASITGIKASGNDGDDRIVIDEALVIDCTLYGGSGSDKLIGGGRNDFISGNGGSDTLLGGGGNDRLNGHGGNDVLFGEAGADRLFGYEGFDYLDGGSSGDRFVGGPGRDTYFGQSGDDFFRADDGDQGEQLFGGSGTDEAIIDFLDQVSSVEIVTRV